MIGKTISHYKILEKIGEGGMGVVYLAEDTELDRKVALKFLPPHYSSNSEVITRFKREAKAAAALNHPNIITVYEVGEHEGQTFIAMEHVKGESLRDRMKQQLAPSESVELISQVCDGLSKAHKADIVHRDIKPENIMIDEDGRVRILDFGLAKLKNVSKLTQTATTLGTLNYMSPEQLQGLEVDARSDIWSVGVVLYEMITGQLPFRAEYEAAISYSILNEEPEPLARYKTGVSEGLQRIIDKALDKELQTRYQNSADLLTDLKRERRSGSELLRPAEKVNTKIKPVLIAVVFAIAAVLAAFVIVNTLQKQAAKFVPATHRQLTFNGNVYLGLENNDVSAISPDGQFVAYVVPKDSRKSLLVQEISGGQPLEIFGGILAVFSLRWSPDGKELALSAELTDSTGGCFIVPRLGGKFHKIGAGWSILCWSPDGSKIARSNWKTILVTDITNGDESSISLGRDFDWLHDIDWSPVSSRLVFLTTDNLEKQFRIWSIKTDGTQQQMVVEDSVGLYSPRWSAHGEAIYYLRARDETRDLNKIKISSADGMAKGEPEILQTGLHAYGITLSRDNKKLSYTKHVSYANLWHVTRKGKGQAKKIETKKLTSGTFRSGSPRISPNGKKVAFTQQNSIFVMPIEGGQLEQLTFLKSDCSNPCWSPDGKELAFVHENRVWRVPSNGGTPRDFDNTEVSSVMHMTWAPGRNILYQRPGNQNFHFLDPKTGEERALVANDSVGWIFSPRYSPDGKEVAMYWNRYIANSVTPSVWLISLEDSSQTLLCKGLIVLIEWSADGKWIYGWNPFEKPIKLLRVPATGGSAATLVTLPFEEVEFLESTGISMTPDGRSIVCAVAETQSDVWLMENFDPDVK